MGAISNPRILTFSADAAIGYGEVVMLGSDSKHVVKTSTKGQKAIGVCQTRGVTTAEDAVEVAMFGGGGEVKIGGTVSRGDYLVGDTDGKAIQADAAGQHAIAFAMEAGVLNDVIACEIIALETNAADA